MRCSGFADLPGPLVVPYLLGYTDIHEAAGENPRPTNWTAVFLSRLPTTNAAGLG